MKLHLFGFALLAMVAMAGLAAGQAAERCDLTVNTTPSPDSSSVCLDLKTDSALGGPTFHAPGNTTRIAYDSLKFCKNVFQVTTSGNADIVFIMDNTASMEFGNPFYCTYPGDPTASRGSVIKLGMQEVRELADTVTAGFISFIGFDTIGIQTRQSLLNISQNNPNGLINLDTLENDVVVQNMGLPPTESCDRANTSLIGASWSPSLDTALSWLNDTALAETQNHAIVMISDGGVNKSDFLEVEAEAGSLPPVYGIFLGDSLDNQGFPNQASANLRELTELTHGQYYPIIPTDTAAMRQVMQTIINTLVTDAVPPASMQIRNAASGQLSRAVSMVTSADGNVNVALDSVLALDSGANAFNVNITLNNGVHTSYPFHVQSDEPDAAQGGGALTCYAPASLAMLDASGEEVESYATGPTSYSFRLNRSPSDLSGVTVRAISGDTSQSPNWGDVENIPLILDVSSAPSVTTAIDLSASPYPFNGNSAHPFPGNGTLEADAGGFIQLNWSHPRDPRENASLVLHSNPSPMTLQRLTDVFRGTPVTGIITRPVVLRTGNVNANTCFYNCGGEAEAATLINPVTATSSAPGFTFHAGAPIRFSLYVYDQLGRFVTQASDSVQASVWQTLSKDGTGMVPVILSIVPRSLNGQQFGTGVYIVRADITTAASGSTPSVLHKFTEEFGYVHP